MIDKNIDRVDRPRDDGVYSARIERDKKKEQQKYQPEGGRDDKKILMATFFSYLKKMFDAFSPSKKLAGKVIDLQLMSEHLLQLKNLLASLGERDLSTDVHFATELSDIWGKILEDFDYMEILERQNLKEIGLFRDLIDQMKNYPPDSEHRFGYYLLLHAGKDWIPFPFLEILLNLHQEHQVDAKKSHIAHWIESIDAIHVELKRNLPFKPS